MPVPWPWKTVTGSVHVIPPSWEWLTDTSPWETKNPPWPADVLQLRHHRDVMLGIERGRRVAGAVARAHRDLSVDPGLTTVEGREEPRRHQRLAGAGGVVEPVVIVVRAGEEMVRVFRVDGDRELVVGREVLAEPRDVAAQIEPGVGIPGPVLATEVLHLRLGELAAARPGKAEERAVARHELQHVQPRAPEGTVATDRGSGEGCQDEHGNGEHHERTPHDGGLLSARRKRAYRRPTRGRNPQG